MSRCGHAGKREDGGGHTAPGDGKYVPGPFNSPFDLFRSLYSFFFCPLLYIPLAKLLHFITHTHLLHHTELVRLSGFAIMKVSSSCICTLLTIFFSVFQILYTGPPYSPFHLFPCLYFFSSLVIILHITTHTYFTVH